MAKFLCYTTCHETDAHSPPLAVHRLPSALWSPAFLEIPGSAGAFFSGFDDSTGINGIANDEMADLFSL